MSQRASIRAGAVIVLAGVCGACSVIYDGDVFVTEPSDAAPPIDAEPPPPDVDPTALAIDELEPSFVYEGAGAGRPVPIVIHGGNIAPNAIVTLSRAGFEDVEVEATIAVGGALAAFEIAIPVTAVLAEGDEDPITVTVSQGDGIEQSKQLMVRGLDEWTASIDAAGGTFDVAQLDARYSRIAIDAPVALTGDGPARFAATAELSIDDALSADGGTASGSSPGAGGPGGCNGGIVEGPGDCLAGGGRAGGKSSGGGGGGHATDGNAGAGGDSAGMGGMASGNERLTPLADARGHGGGGGGNGQLAGAGGAGGGGGGVIELTSDAIVAIGSGALLSADGGGGSTGEGSCAVLDQHGGGGGGGAGGTLFVRAATALTDDGSTPRVSVAPGAGGDGGCNRGGDGAPGRVRVDLPGDAALPPFAGSSAYRGPVLAPDTPAIFRSASLPTRLFGAAGVTYYIQHEGGERTAVTVSSSRAADVSFDLAAGLNRICAVVDDVTSLAASEGVNCLNVAYIP